MAKAMTMRFEDGVYEALRKEAFEARVPMSEIIRTAVNAHLNPVWKMRHPASACDARDCLAVPVGITTPGGFHFCEAHMPIVRRGEGE